MRRSNLFPDSSSVVIMPKPSFRATSDGLLLPHIKAAFIRNLFFTSSNGKPSEIQGHDRVKYKITYDNFPEAYNGEAIASFQQWIDGSNHCIIRPLKQTNQTEN